MSIKPDPKNDGCFLVRYSKRHPITGVSYGLSRKGIKTKREAERVEKELVLRVADMIKRKITPTWGAVLEAYIVSLSSCDLMNKTIYNRNTVLRAHTMPLWADRLIDEITTSEIKMWFQDCLQKNAESHRHFILKSIKSVFEFAIDEGHIQRNPTPLIKFKQHDKIQAVLSEDQIKVVLRRAQEVQWDWYPHVAVALFTGMRNGELYSLTWDKVDLENRRIKVDCSWSKKDGFKSTKSGDDRIVEIPKPLLPVLSELKLKSAGMSFVLPRLRQWDQGEQARELRLFLKMIAIPEVRFHDLRASWATWLLSLGTVPSKVMTMGGWKNMQTMMIYMRKAGIDIKDSTSVLDNIKTHGIPDTKVLNLTWL